MITTLISIDHHSSHQIGQFLALQLLARYIIVRSSPSQRLSTSTDNRTIPRQYDERVSLWPRGSRLPWERPTLSTASTYVAVPSQVPRNQNQKREEKTCADMTGQFRFFYHSGSFPHLHCLRPCHQRRSRRRSRRSSWACNRDTGHC